MKNTIDISEISTREIIQIGDRIIENINTNTNNVFNFALKDESSNKNIVDFIAYEDDKDLEVKKEILKRNVAKRLIVDEWNNKELGICDIINNTFTLNENNYLEFEKECLGKEQQLCFYKENLRLMVLKDINGNLLEKTKLYKTSPLGSEEELADFLKKQYAKSLIRIEWDKKGYIVWNHETETYEIDENKIKDGKDIFNSLVKEKEKEISVEIINCSGNVD